MAQPLLSDSNGTPEHHVKNEAVDIEESGEGSYSTEYENPTNSVTAVLQYCKCKIVQPYMRLLSATGLRSLTIHEGSGVLWQTLNYIYGGIVILLMLLGYFLQYLSCFRRDRGFCYKFSGSNQSIFETLEEEIRITELKQYEEICHGSVLFSYIIPCILHFFAYLYAVHIFKNSENDQLPSLMERVFLSSSYITDGVVIQKKLVKILWLFIALDVLWMLSSIVIVNVMMFEGTVIFRWLDNTPKGYIITLKIILVLCTLGHDMIQATVISNYCLQSQLLTSYLQFLRKKVVQYPTDSINWMREIEEFKNLLRYLNNDVAAPVCIFTFLNLCWFASGVIWLLGYDRLDRSSQISHYITIANVGLWLTLTLAPFIQASRLTNACRMIQEVGHEVRARPFAHQGTPGYELDSILLYTSSLKIQATLFKIPITGRTLTFGTSILAMIVLVAGQCHYLKM